MHTNHGIVKALLVTVQLCGGCAAEVGGEEEENVGQAAQAQWHNNDRVLNGIEVNGVRMNGVRMNGVRMNGVQLAGTVLSGIKESDGTPVNGSGFVGTEMDVSLVDLTASAVRIDSIVPSGTPGLNFYTVKQYDGSTWSNVCPNDVQAIPVNGTWDEVTGDYLADPTKFTFACRGAAIAKCIEWGYEQWGTAAECGSGGDCKQLALSDFHQACTRMVRADYCGDGVYHTMNGTLIDVWDAVGIQTETPGSGLQIEAEWTASGAACVKHTRWVNSDLSNPDKQYILSHCPERWDGPENPNRPASCGTTGSDFLTANGFNKPTSTRRLLRNGSAVNVRP